MTKYKNKGLDDVEILEEGYEFLWQWLAVAICVAIGILSADLILIPLIAYRFEIELWQLPVDIAMLMWVGVAMAWVGASWCNKVNSDEVALRDYFGHIEKHSFGLWKGPLKPGLHFVPWFWGIGLIRFSTEFFRLVYERNPDEPKTWVMSGTMIPVRSKDKQKLLIEATFFLRLPFNVVEMLVLIIESGVPIHDKNKLRKWLASAIDPDLTTAFGDRSYADVMGGLKNGDLNADVNKLIQMEDGLLRKSGLFADDASKDAPGTGEAYIKFKYIHVSGKLGEALENVETAKLEAEAATSIAQNEAKIIGAPLEIMLDEWVRGEARRMGFNPDAPDDLKKATEELRKNGSYERKERSLHDLRSQKLAGGGTFDRNRIEIDVNSAGQPIDPDIAAIIGTAGGLAAAWTAGKGDGGDGGGGDKKKGKKKKKHIWEK